MKKIILLIILAVGSHLYSQFCGAATFNSNITPTGVVQNTAIVNTGRPYWQMTLTAGCTYRFATCGLTSMNTILRMYSGIGVTEVANNDDACGTQSQLDFYCSVTGTYTLLLVRRSGFFPFLNTCNTLNANAQVSYVQLNCTPGPQECLGGTQICNDVSFSGNSSGQGAAEELNASNQGCLTSGENQSSWYYFNVTTSGTIGMNIVTGVDYDFAVWQTSNCQALGAPVRCSFSANTGGTGMSAGFFDTSEDEFGDSYVAPINVIAGQTYIMMIDNFTADGTSFTLDWTMTGGASLNCTPISLPVELSHFSASPKSNYNEITWTTSSEINNSFFSVEKSTDGINWVELGRIQGAGNSNVENTYVMNDLVPSQVTYYMLSQTDFDGTKKYFNTIFVERDENMHSTVGNMFGFYPNPVADLITIQTYNNGRNNISILDASGKELYNTIVEGINTQQVDLSHLNTGLYFIRIENNGSIQNEKLIIK